MDISFCFLTYSSHPRFTSSRFVADISQPQILVTFFANPISRRIALTDFPPNSTLLNPSQLRPRTQTHLSSFIVPSQLLSRYISHFQRHSFICNQVLVILSCMLKNIQESLLVVLQYLGKQKVMRIMISILIYQSINWDFSNIVNKKIIIISQNRSHSIKLY